MFLHSSMYKCFKCIIANETQVNELINNSLLILIIIHLATHL